MHRWITKKFWEPREVFQLLSWCVAAIWGLCY